MSPSADSAPEAAEAVERGAACMLSTGFDAKASARVYRFETRVSTWKNSMCLIDEKVHCKGSQRYVSSCALDRIRIRISLRLSLG